MSDRRVRKTRSSLSDALMELMTEKEYGAITVQDIIDRADVGRSTFYAHFLDKQDLLQSRLDDLKAGLSHDLQAQRATDEQPFDRILGFSRAMFEHAKAHHRVYRAIVGKPAGTMVQLQIQRLLTELVQDALTAELAGKPMPRLPIDVLALSIVGAFMAMLQWWLDQPQPGPVKEVDGMFRAFLQPSLDAACRLRSGGQQ